MHGRIEERRIQVTEELRGYLDFPHAEQVFRIERTRSLIRKGQVVKQEHEVAYGVTSLSAQNCSPQRLGGLVRGHWGIENREHYVRDWNWDEDRCQVRRGQRAWAMAALRNLAIGLLRLAGVTRIAQGVRACSRRAERALRLIGIRVK